MFSASENKWFCMVLFFLAVLLLEGGDDNLLTVMAFGIFHEIIPYFGDYDHLLPFLYSSSQFGYFGIGLKLHNKK